VRETESIKEVQYERTKPLGEEDSAYEGSAPILYHSFCQ